MNTCIVIPTFNESKAIARLIEEIKALNLNLRILVIDDGSEDDTSRIAAEHGASVLRNEKNQGKGASLIKGFDYALQNNFAAVITMDGDGQHLPQDIPHFLRMAEFSGSQIFVGNRMQTAKNMPLVRMLTNKFMSWLISLIIKQEINDTQCGFRLIKRQALEKIKLSATKYETESELLIRGARSGFRIESVSIKTIYGSQKSRINPLWDTLRFIGFIMKETWISRS